MMKQKTLSLSAEFRLHEKKPGTPEGQKVRPILSEPTFSLQKMLCLERQSPNRNAPAHHRFSRASCLPASIRSRRTKRHISREAPPREVQRSHLCLPKHDK